MNAWFTTRVYLLTYLSDSMTACVQATELLRKCSIDDHEARPFDWCGSDHAAELILVNTHLMFPHNGNACVIRLRQVGPHVDYGISSVQ
jgi:hypothetical protein